MMVAVPTALLVAAILRAATRTGTSINLDAAGVLTIIALVVAVVLGARGGIQRSTIGALKEQNDAYERRERAHLEETDRLTTERQEKDDRTDAALKRLGDRNDYLEELVLRRAEGDALIKIMEKHDGEAAARHAASLLVLEKIAKAQDNRREVEERLVQALAEHLPPGAERT